MDYFSVLRKYRAPIMAECSIWLNLSCANDRATLCRGLIGFETIAHFLGNLVGVAIKPEVNRFVCRTCLCHIKKLVRWLQVVRDEENELRSRLNRQGKKIRRKNNYNSCGTLCGNMLSPPPPPTTKRNQAG